MEITTIRKNFRTLCKDRDKIRKLEMPTPELDRAIFRLHLIEDLNSLVWPLSTIYEWLDTKLDIFDGKSPNQLIEEDNFKPLDEMLERIR